jgi:type I restriction enzyme S subunit
MSVRFHNFNSEGTVFGSINKTALAELKIVVPPHDILRVAETILSSLDKQIESNSLQINTLAQMRDALLPRLISGQVRVPL